MHLNRPYGSHELVKRAAEPLAGAAVATPRDLKRTESSDIKIIRAMAATDATSRALARRSIQTLPSYVAPGGKFHLQTRELATWSAKYCIQTWRILCVRTTPICMSRAAVQINVFWKSPLAIYDLKNTLHTFAGDDPLETTTPGNSQSL